MFCELWHDTFGHIRAINGKHNHNYSTKSSSKHRFAFNVVFDTSLFNKYKYSKITSDRNRICECLFSFSVHTHDTISLLNQDQILHIDPW